MDNFILKIENQINIESQLEILIFLIKEFLIKESKTLNFEYT